MKRGTINMRSAYFVLQCIYIHLNNRRPEFHFGRGRLFHVNFRSTKYSDMKMFAKNLPSNRLSRPLLHQREQWTRGQLGPIIFIRRACRGGRECLYACTKSPTMQYMLAWSNETSSWENVGRWLGPLQQYFTIYGKKMRKSKKRAICCVIIGIRKIVHQIWKL